MATSKAVTAGYFASCILAASSVIVDMATLQAAVACWKRACRWLSFAVFVSRFQQASIFALLAI